MRRSCKGCRHYRNLFRNSSAIKACHYILDTGNRRGCPVDNCNKYLKRGNKYEN